MQLKTIGAVNVKTSLQKGHEDLEASDMKVFIDLFCGLGGASSAFSEHNEWKGIMIDNNPELIPHVRGLIISDLSEVRETWDIIRRLLSEEPNVHEIFLWMSPPCNQFSYASGANRPDFPDLELIQSCKRYISLLDAYSFEHGITFNWLIENVKGAIPWFDQVLGMPWHQRIGPIFLWGEAPYIDFKDASDREHRKDFSKGTRLLRANVRAMIPWSVSSGLLGALEYQTSLEDFHND